MSQKLLYGTTRIVILIGRWAIKVPAIVEWRLFLNGLLANMQEARFSRAGWRELCPVLWAMPGGFLLVMRRTIPLTREEWYGFDYTRFINGGGEYIIPVEEKMDSFGVLDGRIVAVDYGQ